MLRTRVMPCLLLRNGALVKTIRFRDARYIGDPINTMRIYNEKEVDELIVLDISATPAQRPPRFELIQEIVSECFMPVAYGGGVRTLDDMTKLFRLGVEKVALNTILHESPDLVAAAAAEFGSQALIGSIDVGRDIWGRYRVRTRCGRTKTGQDPVTFAQRLEELGIGEILLTSIDRDGSYEGYDLSLIAQVSAAVGIPVVASGGAASVRDFGLAVREAGASAVAAGSMVVFQGKNRGVLINFPSKTALHAELG